MATFQTTFTHNEKFIGVTYEFREYSKSAPQFNSPAYFPSDIRCPLEYSDLVHLPLNLNANGHQTFLFDDVAMLILFMYFWVLSFVLLK